MLYGRDVRLPGEEALSTKKSPYIVDLDDYKTELMTSLTEVWETTAGTCIKHRKAAGQSRVKPIRPE